MNMNVGIFYTSFRNISRGLNGAMDTLAKRLKSAREAAGLTQVQLSEAAGLPQPLISKIERGIVQRTTNILALAKALNVNPHWLDLGDGNMKNLADGQIQSVPVRKVKLLKLEDSGMYLEALADPGIEATEFCGLETGPQTFAVLVTNDSAAPAIPKGSVLMVDPEEAPRESDWIIANQDGHTVIKQVMRDGADLYLESRIKPRSLDNVDVIGTVIGIQVYTRPRRR